MNGKKAAIEAGYAEKSAEVTASRLLRNAKVKEYIEARKKEVEDVLKFSKITLVSDMLKVKERCMQAEPVKEFVDGEWQETGQYKFDSRGAVKAGEQVAKMMGYNAPDKVDVTSGGQRVKSINYVVPKEAAHASKPSK